jgi:hypothetical protein
MEDKQWAVSWEGIFPLTDQKELLQTLGSVDYRMHFARYQKALQLGQHLLDAR